MAQTGANISSGTGTGEAGVLHWEQFNTTLAQIQHRDLTNKQYIQDQFNKMQLQLGDSQKTMRAADIPKFMEGVKSFRMAGLMLQSPKVLKDPVQRAFWQGKLDDAYYSNLNLANSSTKQSEEKAKMWNMAATNPGAFKDFPELAQASKIEDGLTIDQIRTTGFNTLAPYLHAPETYKGTGDAIKDVLGDRQVVPSEKPVYNDKKQLVGWDVNQNAVYMRPTSEIAMKAAQSLGNRNYNKNAQNEWMQTKDEDKLSTIQEAQKIIDSDPNNHGQKLPMDYTGLYTAKMIIEGSKPYNLGQKEFKPNPEYLQGQRFENEKALKKLGFEYGMRLKDYGASLQIKVNDAKADKKKTVAFEMGNKLFEVLKLDAMNDPRPYTHDGVTEIQYNMKIDNRVRNAMAIVDPTTNKKVYPDEVRVKQNGDILPVFYKYEFNSKTKKMEVAKDPNTGKAAVDMDKTKPVKQELFKIDLSKGFLTGKAANEDYEADLSDDGEISFNDVVAPRNALAGLAMLVNSPQSA